MTERSGQVLLNKPDVRLTYFYRGMNHARSHKNELIGKLTDARDESTKSEMLRHLKEIDRITECLKRDPAGLWRFKPFSDPPNRPFG